MLNQAVPAPARTTSPAEPRRLPVWALVPAAAGAWWVLGFLFWLLDGLENRFLPLTAGTLRLAVPLVSGSLGQLVTGALTGGVVAGMLGLAARPGRRPPTVAATFAGVALAVTVALVWSGSRLLYAAGGEFDGDSAVVLGLSLVVVALALAGWGVGTAALLGRSGTGVALAVLAGLAPSWVSAAVYAADDPGFSAFQSLGLVSAWVGAAVLVVALVVVGIRPVTRLLWWPVLIVVAWFLESFLTAVAYLTPMLRSGAGLPGTLPDSLAAAVQVFGAASNPASRYLLPWLAVVPVALVVAVVLSRRRDRRPVG